MNPWSPVVFWMILIFILSTDLGSSNNTAPFLTRLLLTFFPALTPDDISLLKWLLRKAGHIFEYTVLSRLLWRAYALQATWPRAKITAAVIATTILYAATDEWHQTFVPTRTGTWTDVGIDSIGALFGTLLASRSQPKTHPGRK